MNKVLLIIGLALLFSFSISKDTQARSGCCSHHGGVCGCRCCDGSSLSAKCAPYYPSCSQPAYIAPIVTKAPIIYTPRPSTPKSTLIPTLAPTRTPTSKPTVSLTKPPTIEPEVKSATTKNTPIPSIHPEKPEINTKDTLIGFGVLGTFAGGSIWIIRKIIRKTILSIKYIKRNKK